MGVLLLRRKGAALRIDLLATDFHRKIPASLHPYRSFSHARELGSVEEACLEGDEVFTSGHEIMACDHRRDVIGAKGGVRTHISRCDALRLAPAELIDLGAIFVREVSHPEGLSVLLHKVQPWRRSCARRRDKPCHNCGHQLVIAAIHTMKTRLNHHAAAPGAIAAQRSVEAYVRQSGIEHSLLELVKIRASQLNGCAFCLDMHTRDARATGETEQRLYLLSAWREAPVYTERERAALEWTDAVTLVADGHVPDEVFRAVRPHFTDEELVNLTLAIGSINVWNRFAIAFRAAPPVARVHEAVAVHA